MLTAINQYLNKLSKLELAHSEYDNPKGHEFLYNLSSFVECHPVTLSSVLQLRLLDSSKFNIVS